MPDEQERIPDKRKTSLTIENEKNQPLGRPKESFRLQKYPLLCLVFIQNMKKNKKQARKSSDDAQAAGYAQLEKVWAR